VFVVEFQPYGLADGATAVVKLKKVTAEGGTALAADFAKSLVGQNLLASLSRQNLGALKAGGTYSGRLALKKDGAASSFSLTEVRRQD